MKQLFFPFKRFSIFLAVLFLLGAVLFPIMAKADHTVVIVIDPGHGGKNLGAQYEGLTEKEMTMITAKAMKEELEKYEGVVVYLTHEGDENMSIKDRALLQKKEMLISCSVFTTICQSSIPCSAPKCGFLPRGNIMPKVFPLPRYR